MSSSAVPVRRRAVAGPSSVVDIVADSARPSLVHTAPAVSQARPPASVTVTSPSESGLTVTSHRSLRLSTRFARFTLPPDTDNDWSRNVRKLIEMPSLNPILSLNAVFPSCSAGTSTKLAVSGTTAGPATVADGLFVSVRGLFP